MAVVGEADIEINADTSDFGEETRRKVEAQLRRIEGKLKVLPDVARFEAELKKAVADQIGDIEAEIGMKVDSSGVAAEIRRAVRLAEAAAPKVEVETKVDSDPIQRLSGIAGRVFGRVRNELAVTGGEFRLLGRNIAAFNRIFQTIGALVTVVAFPALAAGLSAAASAAAALVAELTPLVGLLGTLPQVGVIAAQAFGTLGIALLGVQNGFKALQNVAESAGETAIQNSLQQRAASRAIENAQQRVDRAMTRAGDAQRRLERANRTLASAQRALNRELREAAQRFIDIQREARRASLDVERARLRLAQARRQRREVAEDPDADNLERREAKLDVRDAELSLAEAVDRQREAEERRNEAQRVGIEGDEQVIAARERLVEAHEGIAEANQDIAESQAAIVEANQDVIDAFEVLAERLDQAGQRMDKLGRDFDKLGAAGQRFTRFLFDEIRPKFEALRDAAQEGLFPGLERAIRRLTDTYFPLLRDTLFRTGQSLGRLAERGAELLTSGPFQADFKRLAESNLRVIETLGTAALNFADALRNIASAAAPLVEDMANLVKELSEQAKAFFQAKRDTGELEAFFRRTGEVVRTIVGIIIDLTVAFFNFAGAVGNQGMLDNLATMAQRLRDFTSSEEGLNRIKAWFDTMRPVWEEAGRLIGAIVESFGRISLASAPGMQELLETIRVHLLPVLEELFISMGGRGVAAITRLIEAVSRFLAALGPEGMGFITSFLNTLAFLIDKVAALIEQFPILGRVIGTVLTVMGVFKAVALVGSILTFGHLKEVISGVMTVLGLLFKVIRAHPIAALITAIALLIGWLIKKYQEGGKVKEIIDDIFWSIGRLPKTIGEVIDKIKDWIGKLKDLSDKIPDWLKPGSPSPFEESLTRTARLLKRVGLLMGEAFSDIQSQMPTIGFDIKEAQATLRQLGAVADTNVRLVKLDNINIPITANFGPGTTAEDVTTAMRDVARNEITDALTTVLQRSMAGVR